MSTLGRTTPPNAGMAAAWKPTIKNNGAPGWLPASFTLNLTWPVGTPVGTTLYAQAWVLDGLAVNSVSASNALQTTQQP